MNKIPQHSNKLEQAVLGILLLFPESIHSVKGFLTFKDFYNSRHCEIFRAMCQLTEQNLTIDVASVAQRCNNIPIMMLNDLLNASSTAVNIVDIAKQIKALSAQRNLLYTAIKIVDGGYRRQDNVEKFLAESMTAIVEAASVNTGSDPKHIKIGLSDLTKSALEGRQSSARQKTGIKNLDYRIGGIPRGVITVIGGRPGMGKSSIALIIAIHISKAKPVLYFTLEDSVEMMQSRVLSNFSGIPYFDINNGNVSLEQGKDLMLAQADAQRLDLYFDDHKSSVEEIAQKTASFSGTHGKCGAVVIDLLGYIANSKRHNYNKSGYDTISDKIRNLTYIAKDLDCPLILPAQLNRGVENRADNRPMMSDFRDSGKIEEDCKCGILLYRDFVYNKDADPRSLQLIIGKNTGGPTGVVNLDFDMTCCRIM